MNLRSFASAMVIWFSMIGAGQAQNSSLMHSRASMPAAAAMQTRSTPPVRSQIPLNGSPPLIAAPQAERPQAAGPRAGADAYLSQVPPPPLPGLGPAPSPDPSGLLPSTGDPRALGPDANPTAAQAGDGFSPPDDRWRSAAEAYARSGYDPYHAYTRPPVSLDQASWMYQPAPPMRVFRKNDVITIRVDEITRMMAEGWAEQRKRTLTEAILTDWIRLQDWRLRPDPQENGDPAISAESNNNYRAQSMLQARESLTFNIAATVVDVRPNGNLVLEARKAIRINDNLWETSLSGMCRVEDIGPDNVVLSKDVIDLEIRKEDRGHLRDGYARGWLKRFIDRFGPF